MDPVTSVTVDLTVGLISAYAPSFTDKLFRRDKSKDTLILEVYAEKGPKSGSVGTAYVSAVAYSEYPVSYKLRVRLDSDRVNSLQMMREPIDYTEEMHHLPEDREERRFKFARPLPNFWGSPLSESVTVEVISESGELVESVDFILEYID